MIHFTLFSFYENMTVIIALMYLITKLQQLYLTKQRFIKMKLVMPLLFSLLAYLVMLHPLLFQDYVLDLRYVPIFLVTYLFGWKYGLLALILPTMYRYYIGGPIAIDGILFAIILPYIVAAVFHLDFYSKPIILNITRILRAYLLYEGIKTVIFYLYYDIPLNVLLSMIVFGVFSIFAMALIINDANRMELQKQKLKTLSNYDDLTALPNLRFFKEQVQSYLNNGEKVTIAMIDIDHFKQYNDTHGHPAGDVALRSVGYLLKLASTKQDIVARYGGEEFIACLRNADDKHEESTLEGYRKIIERYQFLNEDTQPKGKITISIGASHGDTSKTLDQLIIEADDALYESKRNGRNLLTYYALKK